MEMISRTIGALTTMIAVNNNRMKAYQLLANKADQGDLKAFCQFQADQARQFIKTLSTWRSAYGGFGVSDDVGGNAWTQLRSLLDFGLRRGMFSHCEDLEKEALQIYRSALEKSIIPGPTVADVQRHMKEFEKNLTKLRRFNQQPQGVQQGRRSGR